MTFGGRSAGTLMALVAGFSAAREGRTKKELPYTRQICFILPDDARLARFAPTATLRRIPLDQPQGPRLSRRARAARQGRRRGARRRHDAAVGLSPQASHPDCRRRLGAGAGDRPGASSIAAAGQSADSVNSPAARRRFGSGKVTVPAGKATLSGRKATLLPSKVTVSAGFASGHCHIRQHSSAGAPFKGQMTGWFALAIAHG